jgi:FHS family glucose/mannose:H+ symporter-like MFS transporter
MPGLAFATNFLWVMVIGLLGPSLPAIVEDLGISYAQAGLFFTLLSLGSLFGASLGASASDRLPRKALYAACALCLAAGLALVGFMPGYITVAGMVFLLSVAGSPLGSIGQSIMLGAAPGRRERNLSLFTTFGAMGSLIAPILVSANFTAGLAWRFGFLETAGIALALGIAIFAVPIPKAGVPRERTHAFAMLANRRVLATGVMIFFSVAIDLGFVYWLAEYFASELGVSLRLSSSVVGVYLVGIISGRLLMPLALKRLRAETLLPASLTLTLGGILAFILVPGPGAKAGLCAVYGLGVGPVFPLLMARGTREFPEQSGAVSGILYAGIALGGMAFPLLVGALAGKFGIARSYWFCAAAAGGLLIAALTAAARPSRRRRPRFPVLDDPLRNHVGHGTHPSIAIPCSRNPRSPEGPCGGAARRSAADAHTRCYG